MHFRPLLGDLRLPNAARGLVNFDNSDDDFRNFGFSEPEGLLGLASITVGKVPLVELIGAAGRTETSGSPTPPPASL